MPSKESSKGISRECPHCQSTVVPANGNYIDEEGALCCAECDTVIAMPDEDSWFEMDGNVRITKRDGANEDSLTGEELRRAEEELIAELSGESNDAE